MAFFHFFFIFFFIYNKHFRRGILSIYIFFIEDCCWFVSFGPNCLAGSNKTCTLKVIHSGIKIYTKFSFVKKTKDTNIQKQE